MKFPIQKVGKWESMAGLGDGEILLNFLRSHRIHVWYVYLHFADLYGKCR